MQRALLAAGLAGLVCAVVGIFVVLKGMAFMGDAVAHSSLAGMSVAYFFGGNVFWGGLGCSGFSCHHPRQPPGELDACAPFRGTWRMPTSTPPPCRPAGAGSSGHALPAAGTT